MSVIYLISHRDRPHIVVFTSGALAEVAESLAAQADPEAFVVSVNEGGGFSRPLSAAEQQQLAELVG